MPCETSIVYIVVKTYVPLVLRLSDPHSLARLDSDTKAAFFEGGPETKKESVNTACNRVNCADYAFISLFRDNLLIVSTKRDNPLVAVCSGRFFGGL